jgi:hypothetical protein
VLSSVLGSAIGGGLTSAAVSNTCTMGTALSELPDNRTATFDASQVVSRLGDAGADGV